MTAGWLILSDCDQPPLREASPLPRAALVAELAWPLPQGVLLDWRDPSGADRALSVFHHRQTGLALLWREGAQLRRYLLPGSLSADGVRVARLTFRWDLPADTWHLRLDGGDGTEIAATMGLAPAAPPLAAVALMAAGRGVARRDGAVLWFGLLDGDAPPARAPWIGRATPVPTPAGLVPASALRAGDWVMTQDAGPMRLHEVRDLAMPSRGSHAAIVLRAPYHARDRDILISADQMVALGGAEAEYLFGEEEVLVAAGALADGRSAVQDNRRAVTKGISLDFGGALHLIDAGGCVLLSGHHGSAATAPLMPLRAIRDYEAAHLMSLLRRLRPSDAA